MRRWLTAALSLCLIGCGCTSGAGAAATSVPSAAARPTVTVGLSPSLPVARAVSSPSPGAAPSPGVAGFQTFALQSTAFTDGATLPPEYTCDGGGQSPPLTWSGAPPGTAAYALIEQDVDSTAGGASQPFTEWLLYNMPSSVTQLQAGVPATPLLSNGVQQGTNDGQSVGYLGACPDHGQPPHHLQFALYAQDAYVTLETGAAYAAVHDALLGHTVGQTVLTAVVQR